MSRFITLAVGGTTALALTIGSVPPVHAAPLPALTATQVGGKATVDQVGWRRGYYGGWGRRRGAGIGGALVAGAALGLIGTAIAASARPRYYGYGYPAYGGYYGGYGGYGYPYAW